MVKMYARFGTLEAKIDRCQVKFRMTPTVHPSIVTVLVKAKSDDEEMAIGLFTDRGHA